MTAPTPAEVAQMREALVLVDACQRVRELQAALRVAIWDRDELWAGYSSDWPRTDREKQAQIGAQASGEQFRPDGASTTIPIAQAGAQHTTSNEETK